MAANFDLVWFAKKKKRKRKKKKEKERKRKKKEDFLNGIFERLTYPFSLSEIYVEWTSASSSNISVHDAITYLIYETAASHMTFSEAVLHFLILW